jgi:segregation and condensation protein B
MEGNMTPITADMVEEMPVEDLPTTAEAPRGEQAEAASEQELPAAESVAQAVAERELKAILEAMLFVSSEPLSVTRFVSVLGDVTKAEVERVLQALGEELEQEGRGVRLAEVAGGYRLVTKQEYATWIKRLDKAKSTAKLSRSALESLAIIAYKQPIVRSEIEEIRGVETSGVVRTLLERKLVRIVGRKEVPGRPIMYGTTKYFLEHFGLNDLSQLPPLREFKELGESEQALLPMEAEPVTSMTPEPVSAGAEVLSDPANEMEDENGDASCLVESGAEGIHAAESELQEEVEQA